MAEQFAVISAVEMLMCDEQASVFSACWPPSSGRCLCRRPVTRGYSDKRVILIRHDVTRLNGCQVRHGNPVSTQAGIWVAGLLLQAGALRFGHQRCPETLPAAGVWVCANTLPVWANIMDMSSQWA